MKRLTPLILGAIVAAVLAAGALGSASAPRSLSISIRHQTHHCHAWAVGTGTYKAALSVNLARGGSIRFTNNDVMPHKLVLTSGPALHIAHATLGHMGASLKVALTKPGTYHFTTKPGEDYPGMSGMKTTGEDNVLKLTVVVS